jgi:hypothetical protein
MNELERLQAAIAEHKRRWKEKYGWSEPPREYPTMEEVMRREMKLKETRAANAFIRMHISKVGGANDDECMSNEHS